ncbi:MAG TPA: hypothetical protein VK788_14215 [Terriglobales bacterium]|nr:hypothetical protein [Terriglobales bacterium]
MEVLKDKYGRPQGLIREIAGGQERLFDIDGQAIATYRPSTNFTYNKNVPTRIAFRGRAARRSNFLGVFLYCANQKAAQREEK